MADQIKSINPATEEINAAFTPHQTQDIEDAIIKSVDGFKLLKTWSYEKRKDAMLNAAKILEDNNDKYATILTQEMGKPLTSAKAEVAKCADLCRHYAEHATTYLADRIIETNASQSYVRYLPMGPVLAVMPWNFPFWQAFRFAVPALMAGNTGILKHASNVPQSALAIESILTEAGFHPSMFQALLISSNDVASILEDPRIRAATLTGSEGAGSAVAATCGKHLKKTVLELGGSDPFIIMPSADLDQAIEKATLGRINNNGQTCVAAKRYIIHADIYDEVRDRLIDTFKNLKVGDPMNEETQVGPLSMAQIRDELGQQVQDTLKAGATLLCGAKKIEGKGYYYQPGLLENIPKDAPAYYDELFGPVASLFKVASLEEAVELGNATRFGLGSAIFTQNKDEIEYAINHLDAGCTFVNQIVASDPRIPFGGVKASGYGRELSEEGIREFCNVKTISIA